MGRVDLFAVAAARGCVGLFAAAARGRVGQLAAAARGRVGCSPLLGVGLASSLLPLGAAHTRNPRYCSVRVRRCAPVVRRSVEHLASIIGRPSLPSFRGFIAVRACMAGK